MSDAEIVSIMENYIEAHIERSYAVFGNMPICPFVKKARLDHKVLYRVYKFYPFQDLHLHSDLFHLFKAFREDDKHDVMMVIHPDRQALSLDEMNEFVQQLNHLLRSLNLTAFSGHPLDEFNIGGVYTRRDPFINFTVQDQQTLENFSKMLKSTAYYDNWTEANLDHIQHSH